MRRKVRALVREPNPVVPPRQPRGGGHGDVWRRRPGTTPPASRHPRRLRPCRDAATALLEVLGCCPSHLIQQSVEGGDDELMTGDELCEVRIADELHTSDHLLLICVLQ